MKIWNKFFYMRDDLKSNQNKLRLYNILFGLGFIGGLIISLWAVSPPQYYNALTYGIPLLLVNGYFLLSIYYWSRR